MLQWFSLDVAVGFNRCCSTAFLDVLQYVFSCFNLHVAVVVACVFQQLFGVIVIISSWCFICCSLIFQLFFFVVATIRSRCFNFILTMLELLFFFVAIYMFIVFQLLQPIVAAVHSVLLQ